MSEQNHTPEPWVVVAKGDEADGVDYFINQESDCLISGLIASWLSREDARRIVACVNACKGLPTEALEQMDPDTDMLFVDCVKHIINQRDQLLVALKEAKGKVEELCRAFSVPIPDASMVRYEDAIAAVEGGN